MSLEAATDATRRVKIAELSKHVAVPGGYIKVPGRAAKEGERKRENGRNEERRETSQAEKSERAVAQTAHELENGRPTAFNPKAAVEGARQTKRREREREGTNTRECR